MSRKRDEERALARQQTEARRRSNAHRSLRKRTQKRALAGDVTGADAVLSEAEGVTTEPAQIDPTVADAAVDAVEVVPDDAEATEADTAEEASTDTVVFARVPAFLRETEEPATAAAAPEVAPDATTQAEADDGIGEPEAAAPDEPFNIPENAEPAYAPVFEPAPSQEETMVMDPVAANTEPFTQQQTTLESPMDDVTAATPPKQKKRRRWPWIVLAVLLIIAALYYGLATYFGSRVPANTQALGVDISGQTVDQATATLDVAAAQVETAPITLTAATNTTTVVPSDAGLSIDTSAMANDATGFTLNPITVFSRLTGGTQLDPVVLVDDDAMDAAMKTASVELDTAAVDAEVVIVGTSASTVPGTSSVTVDHRGTAQRIAADWPAQAQIEAVATVAEANVPDHEADRTVSTLNDKVLASAVTLTGPNGSAVLEPAQFASLLTTTPADGRLEIIADGAALSAALRAADPTLESEPVDATLSFDKKHKLVTTDGVPGRALDDKLMGPALVDATMTVDHTGPLAYAEVHPKVSTEDLGIEDLKEVVSSFSTPLTNESIRTKNLVRGAQKVTGVVVQPNEDFDLTAALEPITAADGFYLAHVIVDGVLVDGIGGGLSQMATTTYNAGYFAGYKDVTHQPHSKYFARYPAGREATIYTGSINMVFNNNTPYAAVMSSYVENNRLYVDIWSTPYFTVKTEASPKTNIVMPKTVEVDSPGCLNTGFGEPGFKISNTRTVFLDGTEVDKTTNTWTYQPDNKIVCKKPKD